MKMKATLLFLTLCATLVLTKQKVCTSEDDCETNFFCDLTSHYCYKCLSCEQLNRNTLKVTSPCIRSVQDCGSCLDGLVEDPSGDVTAPCVQPPQYSGAPPPYVWVLVALSLLLIVAVGVCLYLYRHTDTLKVCTLVQSPHPSEAAVMSPPPPYAPTSPPLDSNIHPHVVMPFYQDECECARPFIKRTENGAANVDRVEEDAQRARVFNNPNYVRGPDIPPSYDAATKDDEPSPGPPLDDENTMESLWTPSEDVPVHPQPSSDPAPSASSALELPSLLSEARSTTLIRPPRSDSPVEPPPPTKVPCVRPRQDSNNNGNARSRDSGEGPSSAIPSLTFNITVQQHNELRI